MINKLREIIEPKIEILGEQKTKDGSLTILAPWIQADRKNNNGRLYPLSLLQREIAQTQKRIEQGSAIGSADHPRGAFTTLSDASHIITKLEIDKSGKGWMTAKILPTSKGKNVIEIINAGGQLGISARGAGTVGRDGKVESDYKLLGIDIVTNPSEPTAVFDQSNIFESLDFEGENKGGNMKQKMMGISEDYIQEMMKDVYDLYIAEGTFTGSFESFKKRDEKFVLAAILVEEEKFKNTDEALEHLDKFKDSGNKNEDEDLEKAINKLERESYLNAVESGFKGEQKDWLKNCGSLREAMGIKKDDEEERVEKLTEEMINKRIRGYYHEAVAGGFKGDFNAWKEQYPKIVEMAKQPIKIAEKKKEKREFDGRMTLAEARGAGFKGTTEDFKKRYPEMELIVPEPPQKIKEVLDREMTEKELISEAGRIFTALSKDNPSSLTLEDVKKLLRREEGEKVDKRIRRKAIQIVSQEADGSVSHEKLKEMVEIEIKALKEARKKRLEANWKCYRRLLD